MGAKIKSRNCWRAKTKSGKQFNVIWMSPVSKEQALKELKLQVLSDPAIEVKIPK